jgi:tetratricopeptide (TPR) repeat protein
MSGTDRLSSLMAMLAADPADAFCLYGVAQEHAKADRLDQAVAWFERLLQAHPDHAYGHYHLAKVLERSGRMPEAEATLRRGLDAARRVGDAKAAGELASFLDEITP